MVLWPGLTHRVWRKECCFKSQLKVYRLPLLFSRGTQPSGKKYSYLFVRIPTLTERRGTEKRSSRCWPATSTKLIVHVRKAFESESPKNCPDWYTTWTWFCQALPKWHEPNEENDCCFKPLGLELICGTAIDNWNKVQSRKDAFPLGLFPPKNWRS